MGQFEEKLRSIGGAMRFLVGILAASLSAGPALAQEKGTVLWKELEAGWRIIVDRTLKDGCFLIFSGERGTQVRIGFTETRELYWLVWHEEWKSLERGKEYLISGSFDGGSPFIGKMYARLISDRPMLVASITKDFLANFMRGQAMVIRYGDRQLANISLRASYVAGEELLLCQSSIDQSRPPSAPQVGDPFSRPAPPPARDPFR